MSSRLGLPLPLVFPPGGRPHGLEGSGSWPLGDDLLGQGLTLDEVLVSGLAAVWVRGFVGGMVCLVAVAVQSGSLSRWLVPYMSGCIGACGQVPPQLQMGRGGAPLRSGFWWDVGHGVGASVCGLGLGSVPHVLCSQAWFAPAHGGAGWASHAAPLFCVSWDHCLLLDGVGC